MFRFSAAARMSRLKKVQWTNLNPRRPPLLVTGAASALGLMGVAAIAATLKYSQDDLSSSSSLKELKCFCESVFQLDSNTITYNDNDTRLGNATEKEQPKAVESDGHKPFRLKEVYDIERVLGEGAYGLVYQARRKADGVLVALKTMPREYTGKTDFEREVAALQLLSQPPNGPHNHVVRLYDLHRDDKNYYLAMELVEGGELFDHLVENGPYSEAVAASFLRQFAEAICFVHSTGLTHCDLKPENLMLATSSSSLSNHNDVDKATLKVVDFGCACNHDLSRKEMQLPAKKFAEGCSFLHQVALGKSVTELDKMLKERPDLVNFRDYDRRTALHIAASEGHVDTCRYLVENGAQINRSDRWGGFPLDDAHRHRHSEVVQFLRQHGARFGSTSRASNLITAASEGNVEEVQALLEFGHIDLNQGDYDRRTALHLAAGEGHLETVKLLCKAGANVNVEDRWGNRPFDDAKNAKKDSTDILKVLQKYGAKSSGVSTMAHKKAGATMHELKDASNKQDNMSSKRKEEHEDVGMTDTTSQKFAMGCSVLHQAALGNQFELEKILWEWPDLVNFRDYDRRTALHIAASEGHVDICRYLVEKGAQINRSDRWGGSPLDDAHRHGHADVVQFLRQRGARFGSTSQETNFIAAASEGDKEEVQAFLELGDIDLNKGDYDRRTALHLAAGEGRSEIVELLCKAGADVNVEDRWGNRPLDDAKRAKKNSFENMRLLQKYGAKFGTLSPAEPQQVTARDSNDNRTPQNDALKLEEEHFAPPTGTIAYCPPEMFAKGATPTPAADMWATGVIMFVLLTGSHPFDKHADKTDDEIQEVIIRVGKCSKDSSDDGHVKLMDELVFDERVQGLSDSCVELMRQLMQPDPNKRMSSDDFRRHPWIQGLTVSWKNIEQTYNDQHVTYWQDKFRTQILKNYATDNAAGTVSEKDLVEMFHSLDRNKKGVLELQDIAKAFRDDLSENDVRTMFACMDLDGTGVIHWEEFRALVSRSQNQSDGRRRPGLQVSYLQHRFKSQILNRFAPDGHKTETSSLTDKRNNNNNNNNIDLLREIFNAIDLEGNGVLDPHEIRVVLRSVGEPEDVISRIVASLDLDRDGGVSWQEFLEVMSTEDDF